MARRNELQVQLVPKYSIWFNNGRYQPVTMGLYYESRTMKYTNPVLNDYNVAVF